MIAIKVVRIVMLTKVKVVVVIVTIIVVVIEPIAKYLFRNKFCTISSDS